jgi:hypothetical protein
LEGFPFLVSGGSIASTISHEVVIDQVAVETLLQAIETELALTIGHDAKLQAGEIQLAAIIGHDGEPRVVVHGVVVTDPRSE